MTQSMKGNNLNNVVSKIKEAKAKAAFEQKLAEEKAVAEQKAIDDFSHKAKALAFGDKVENAILSLDKAKNIFSKYHVTDFESLEAKMNSLKSHYELESYSSMSEGSKHVSNFLLNIITNSDVIMNHLCSKYYVDTSFLEKLLVGEDVDLRIESGEEVSLKLTTDLKKLFDGISFNADAYQQKVIQLEGAVSSMSPSFKFGVTCLMENNRPDTSYAKGLELQSLNEDFGVYKKLQSVSQKLSNNHKELLKLFSDVNLDNSKVAKIKSETLDSLEKDLSSAKVQCYQEVANFLRGEKGAIEIPCGDIYPMELAVDAKIESLLVSENYGTQEAWTVVMN